ncbi:MAG TPA: restriction endonuclease [Chthoniobacterales bacterium]
MTSYDFHKLLSYLDFEHLSQDLLEAELGLRFENFRDGADQGIDLRHAPARPKMASAIKKCDGSIIVQCKRYSAYASLKSTLVKELAKVKRLDPQRYILATTVSLSPAQVDELTTILSPYICSTDDIFGKERLEHLLSKHTEVERRHVKLWASSAGVLDTLLHAGSHSVSRDEVNKTIAAAKFYVRNQSFTEALDILDQHRVCIISGQPGIGKTTLARQLLLYFFDRNYEIVKIESDISEARDRSFHEKPRFYYYDDFLGQTGRADKLNKNEDQKLIDFMYSVKESKNSVFVLTTREYILNQARLFYEKLDREPFDHRTCTIDLGKYSRRNCGQILYNHLHFSGVPERHIAYLVDTRSYLKIIDHRNYNPRLIESLTAPEWIARIEAKEYPEHFLATLDNPIRLWEHAFFNHLSTHSRHLLLVLTTLRTEVRMSDLRIAFDTFHRAECHCLHQPIGNQDFRNALKELDGTFIQIQEANEDTIIEFKNPSVRDFMQNLVCSGEWLPQLIGAFAFFEQAEWIDFLRYSPQSLLPVSQAQKNSFAISAALKRTFLAESCSIRVHRLPDFCFFASISANHAQRMATVVEALSRNLTPENTAWLAQQMEWLTERVREGDIRPLDFADALDSMVATKAFETTSGTLLAQSLREAALDEPCSLGDFQGLAKLIEFLPAFFSEDDLDAAKVAYCNFAENYSVDHGIKNPEEIRQAAEQLEDLGETFKVDVDDHRQAMHDQASEKENEEPENWEPDDDERPAANETECSDSELESMFRTIRS